MKKILPFILVIGFILFLANCKKEKGNPDPNPLPEGTSYISPSAQRSGDATTGRTYLTSGDYISSGIPYNVYKLAFPTASPNLLNRTGDNATIPPGFTAVDAPNGVRVVAPNCMQCHASSINGEFKVGLGNAAGDFTSDQSTLLPIVDGLVTVTYGANSPEWDAYEPFRKATAAIGSKVVTEVRGVNTADKLAAVLAAHRDPQTLEWIDNPTMNIPDEVIPTDVPA